VILLEVVGLLNKGFFMNNAKFLLLSIFGLAACMHQGMNAFFTLINRAEDCEIRGVTLSRPPVKVENENDEIVSRYVRLISRASEKPYGMKYIDYAEVSRDLLPNTLGTDELVSIELPEDEIHYNVPELNYKTTLFWSQASFEVTVSCQNDEDGIVLNCSNGYLAFEAGSEEERTELTLTPRDNQIYALVRNDEGELSIKNVTFESSAQEQSADTTAAPTTSKDESVVDSVNAAPVNQKEEEITVEEVDEESESNDTIK
jgi:hypothetical protein